MPRDRAAALFSGVSVSSSLARPGRLVLLVALAICAAMLSPVDAGATTTSSKPTVRSGNSGYSWWTEPLMARTPGNFYFTGVTADGTQRVYRWGRTKAKRKLHLTYTNLRKRRADDHNAPAISMAKGKPSLVFYTGHPGTMYVRSTTSGANPVLGTKHKRAFGKERKMPFNRPTTYAQVLRDGHRVVVLSRYLGGGKSGWYYVTSANSGRTWTKPVELFDSESHQAYLMVRPKDTDAKKLHVVAYYHPKRGPKNVIGYREMALSDFWNNRAARFTVGSMEPVWTSAEPAAPGTTQPTPTAPAPSPTPTPEAEQEPPPVDPDPTSSEPAPPSPRTDPTDPESLPADPELEQDPATDQPPEVIPPSARSVRLLDVGDKNGRTMVFGATWDEADRVPVYLQMIRQPDGSWTRHTIRSAGGVYGKGNGNYIPGLTMDDRRGVSRIYFGYRAGSRWNLAQAPLGSNGRVGTPKVLRQSTRPLARPVTVGKDLMFQRLDRYTSYRQYFMKVKTFRLR